jgi:hypothetical protein
MDTMAVSDEGPFAFETDNDLSASLSSPDFVSSRFVVRKRD